MAEKIGFISFSAFDLKKANEFEAIKRQSFDRANPSQSWFQHHPSIPPWRQIDQLGIEPALRRTPAEFQPLMNEYHRYFLENAVQHESYLRWVRRHRAWDREAEVTFARFSELRDHLNDKFAREDYARRGRLHQIFDKAAQRTWMQSDLIEVISENEALERKRRSSQALQKKLEAQAMYRQGFEVSDDRQAWKRRDEIASTKGTTREDRLPMLVSPEQAWAHGLAIAHYQSQAQNIPVAPPYMNSPTANTVYTPLAPPIVKKVSGLG